MPEHINTLQQFDDLRASGVPEEQARAQVHALNSAFEGVATKQDLLVMESGFKQDLSIMEKDLKIFFSWEVAAIFITVIGLSIFNRTHKS